MPAEARILQNPRKLPDVQSAALDMTTQLRTSKAGLELIKSFEGFRARAIRLPDGRWTIGHGHLRSAREGVRISKEDAEALLIYDLQRIESAIDDCLLSPLNINQYDALVSFVFNISPGQFRQSEVLRLINEGEHLAAAFAMEAWRRARINGRVTNVDALIRRRAAEKALFLEATDSRALCPTPLIAPLIDPNWQTRKSITDQLGQQAEATASKPEHDVESVSRAVEELADATRLVESGAHSSANGDQAANDDDVPASIARLQKNEMSNENVPDDVSASPTVASSVNRSQRHQHRTPEDAASELRDRISRVLEREEAVAAVRASKKQTQAPKNVALKSSNSGNEISLKIDDLADVPNERANVDAFELSKELSNSRTGTEVSAMPVALGRDTLPSPSKESEGERSKRLSHKVSEVEIARAEEQGDSNFKSMPARSNNDKSASPKILTHPTLKPDYYQMPMSENNDNSPRRGPFIWAMLTMGGVGLAVFGLISFFLKSRATETVSRQEVTFGPMVFFLGLVLALIGAYYYFFRREELD